MTRHFGQSGRVTLVAWTCLALVACGQDDGPAQEPTTGDTEVTSDITVVGADTSVGPDAIPMPPCESDLDCLGFASDVGPCHGPTCNLSLGRCEQTVAPDGTSCDDGQLCTAEDTCLGGVCGGAELACDDDNPCTADACDAATGACSYSPTDAPCDDGQLCTSDDQCVDGACVGEANPICACSNDLECAKFDDGDLCNGVLVCVDSLCVPDDSAVTCADTPAGPCENALCDPDDGVCKVTPKANGESCDDGDACTQHDVCGAGACTGKTVLCEDNNPCTSDGCDPDSNSETGCFHLAAAGDCDDGDLCTNDDSCVDGLCVGVDNPDCSCTTALDCAPYEDGNLCNGTLACVDDHCVVDDETVVSCEAVAQGLAPCQDVSCIPTTGSCVVKASLDGTPCDDFSVCTTPDYCLAGQCAGLSPGCDDGNPCTSEACDPEEGCQYGPLTGVPCDDKNACTIDDSCGDGLCTGETNPACQCFGDADCAEFEDGDLCNGTLVCDGNACIVDPATVVVCSDETDDPCTLSACVPQTGGCAVAPAPNGAPCDDGDACTDADHCEGGQCGGDTISCDDGDVCTSDSCDSAIGCTYGYNLTFCDDGNDCTYLDTCLIGYCVGIQDEDCVCTTDSDCGEFEDDDLCNGTLSCQGNKCVIDPETVVSCPPSADPTCGAAACVPATGVCETAQANDGKPCDDGDACTAGDVCSTGSCLGASPVDCSDGNDCTQDICNGDTGCYNPPVEDDTACDDGDDCTAGDSCSAGACLPGSNTCGGAVCQAQDTLVCGGSDNWGTGFFDQADDIEGYACNTGAYPGNDYVYYFEAPYDGMFDVTLSNETGLTEVFILAQTGSGCDPGNCLDTGYSAAIAEMSQGDGFYIAVDSLTDDSSEYEITLDCVASAESACDDGVDNDGDTDIDCADTDCAESTACAPEVCVPALTLGCGDVDTATSYGVGSTNTLDAYEGCSNPFNYEGAEYAYQFTAAVSTTVTVTLSDESAETDILVLGDDCGPAACLAYGYSDVSFQATEGETYYLVVDGFLGAEGSFTVSVACADDGPAPTGEICDNETDDDGDGQTDCLDADCLGTDAACQPACDAETGVFEFFCPADTDLDWNNGSFGSTNAIDGYPGCFDSGMHTGPEYVYVFTAESDGAITVSKTEDGGAQQLDMFVLRDQGLGCNPATCIEWGTETVTFLAENGATYYIVVDGWQGAEKDYGVSFSCGD